MKLKLMGKFKMQNWEEIDSLNTDDFPQDTSANINHQKSYLLNQWSIALGQGWMFKWETN